MNLPKSFPVELKRGNTMVKIYRVQNGDYAEFRVVYYNTTGERRQRSFADYQKARAEADSVNASFATGNADTLTLSGLDKALYQRASKCLESLGIPLDAAATEYVEAKSLLGRVSLKEAITFYLKQHRSLDQKQVADVVDELVARKEQAGKSHYARALRVRLDKFAEAFQCALASVTPADVERYLDALNGSGRTRFNCASLIKALFRYAQSKNYYPRDINPLERVDMNFKDDGEIEIFSPDELRKLLAHTPEAVLPFLVIGAFAGVRHEEIKRLDWNAIKWERDHIEIKANQSKNRRRGGRARRLVPLQPNLAQWLLPYKDRTGRIAPYANMTNEVLWVAKQAGVDWKRNGLRHSFISYRMALVKNENTVALEAGNSPQMIFSHYRELVTEGEAKEWFSICPEAAK